MAFVDEITGAEAYNWDEAGIYQLEESDPVQAGAGGISNRQATELATRTRNLHERIKAIVDADFLGTIRGGVAAQYDTLEKLRTALVTMIENLDPGSVDVEAILAAIRGGVSEAYDTLQELKDYVDNLSIPWESLTGVPEYTGSANLDTAVIDFSGKPILRKTLASNTIFTAINLIENKSMTLILTGNYTATFPAYFKKMGNMGYDGTVGNMIQMLCTNATPGSEEVWYSVNQEEA